MERMREQVRTEEDARKVLQMEGIPLSSEKNTIKYGLAELNPSTKKLLIALRAYVFLSWIPVALELYLGITNRIK